MEHRKYRMSSGGAHINDDDRFRDAIDAIAQSHRSTQVHRLVGLHDLGEEFDQQHITIRICCHILTRHEEFLAVHTDAASAQMSMYWTSLEDDAKIKVIETTMSHGASIAHDSTQFFLSEILMRRCVELGSLELWERAWLSHASDSWRANLIHAMHVAARRGDLRASAIATLTRLSESGASPHDEIVMSLIRLKH